MTFRTTPPAWAEAILRMSVAPEAFEDLSGDLLEEYRDGHRSGRQADLWYVVQVFGFLWRGTRLWTILFAGAFLARTALDWFVPARDFHTRAIVSTALGIGLLVVAGFVTTLRSGRLAAGSLAGLSTAAVAAIFSAGGAAVLLAVRHDPGTLAAIHESGGLEEVFTLPVLMLLPGVLLGTLGGLAGIWFRKLRLSTDSKRA